MKATKWVTEHCSRAHPICIARYARACNSAHCRGGCQHTSAHQALGVISGKDATNEMVPSITDVQLVVKTDNGHTHYQMVIIAQAAGDSLEAQPASTARDEWRIFHCNECGVGTWKGGGSSTRSLCHQHDLILRHTLHLG